MRKLFYFNLLFLFLISLNACKKTDKCEGKACANGGTCQEGVCVCPTGFEGANCETKNCAATNCLNGGVCNSGICDCPPGYIGENCQTEISPASVKITRVDVIRFPGNDNGAGWDLTSGPDIYPKIIRGSTVYYESPTAEYDANYNNDYLFNINPAAQIANPTLTYTIELWDYDQTDSDDYMGGLTFQFYNSGYGFPGTVILDGGTDVAFKIYLQYQF